MLPYTASDALRSIRTAYGIPEVDSTPRDQVLSIRRRLTILLHRR